MNEHVNDIAQASSGKLAPVVCSVCERATQDIAMCEIKFTPIATNSFDTRHSVSL